MSDDETVPEELPTTHCGTCQLAPAGVASTLYPSRVVYPISEEMLSLPGRPNEIHLGLSHHLQLINYDDHRHHHFAPIVTTHGSIISAFFNDQVELANGLRWLAATPRRDVNALPESSAQYLTVSDLWLTMSEFDDGEFTHENMNSVLYDMIRHQNADVVQMGSSWGAEALGFERSSVARECAQVAFAHLLIGYRRRWYVSALRRAMRHFITNHLRTSSIPARMDSMDFPWSLMTLTYRAFRYVWAPPLVNTSRGPQYFGIHDMPESFYLMAPPGVQSFVPPVAQGVVPTSYFVRLPTSSAAAIANPTLSDDIARIAYSARRMNYDEFIQTFFLGERQGELRRILFAGYLDRPYDVARRLVHGNQAMYGRYIGHTRPFLTMQVGPSGPSHTRVTTQLIAAPEQDPAVPPQVERVPPAVGRPNRRRPRPSPPSAPGAQRRVRARHTGPSTQFKGWTRP